MAQPQLVLLGGQVLIHIKGKVMALIKNEKTGTGIDITYWNINFINENYKNKTIEILLNGYISKEIRDNNFYPASTQTIIFSENDYIVDATRAQIYDALKTKDFADAQDA